MDLYFASSIYKQIGEIYIAFISCTRLVPFCPPPVDRSLELDLAIDVLPQAVEGLYYPANTPMTLHGLIKPDRSAHVTTRKMESPHSRAYR
jgi:hypothetical protein